MTPGPTHGLLVKDIAILACRQGVDWWLTFRERFEPIGRVRPIPGTATPQGDHCWVLCPGSPEDGETSRYHAEWLRNHMINQGVPKSTVILHCSRCNSPFIDDETETVALWDDKHAIEEAFHDPDGVTDVDGWLRFGDRYICEGCQAVAEDGLIEDPEPLPAIEEAVINRTRARYVVALGAATSRRRQQAGGDAA